MPSDQQTTLQELKDKLLEFRDARDWAQFHDAKNLAEALSIEANELLELFLWKTKEDIMEKVRTDAVYLEKIREELADVLNNALCLANILGIDVASSSLEKIEKNAKKYPVEKAKGSAKKYTEL